MIPALALSYLAAMVVAILWVGAIDRRDAQGIERMRLPTARQRRQWKKSRLRLATGNRRRA